MKRIGMPTWLRSAVESQLRRLAHEMVHMHFAASPDQLISEHVRLTTKGPVQPAFVGQDELEVRGIGVLIKWYGIVNAATYMNNQLTCKCPEYNLEFTYNLDSARTVGDPYLSEVHVRWMISLFKRVRST